MPKEDWKPEPSPPIAQAPSHPIKLIASVPSVWEERPGTPLSPPQAKPIDPPLLLLPPPLLDSHGDDTIGPFDDGQEATIGSNDESSGSDTNGPRSITRVPSRPVKLVASVPFVWEEKPGKPLPYFSPHDTSMIDLLLPLPPPPSWSSYEEVSSSGSNNVADGDADDEQEVAYKADVRSFTFETSESPPVPRVPSRRVKLVASVPFIWEEKPGKPLSSFPQANHAPSSVSHDPKLDLCNDLRDPDKRQERISEWEIQSFRFDTDEDASSTSAHSLLANCLMPSSAISTAVPAEETAYSTNENSPKLASSSSTTSLSALETETDTSSYATGASGPVGPAFLEWLFPLFPPKSGFLERSGSPKREAASTANQEVEGRDFGHETNGSLILRRPTTLGELIMMSRRRSYRRKAVHMRKQNPSIVSQLQNKSILLLVFLSHYLLLKISPLLQILKIASLVDECNSMNSRRDLPLDVASLAAN